MSYLEDTYYELFGERKPIADADPIPVMEQATALARRGRLALHVQRTRALWRIRWTRAIRRARRTSEMPSAPMMIAATGIAISLGIITVCAVMAASYSPGPINGDQPDLRAVSAPITVVSEAAAGPAPVIAEPVVTPKPKPKPVQVVPVAVIHDPAPVSTPKPKPVATPKPAPVVAFAHGNGCGVDTWHDSGPDHSYGIFPDAGSPGQKSTVTYQGKTGYVYRVPDQCKPWWHVSCGDVSQLSTSDGKVVGTGFWGGQIRVPDSCDSQVPADRRWSNQPTGYYGASKPMQTQWKP